MPLPAVSAGDGLIALLTLRTDDGTADVNAVSGWTQLYKGKGGQTFGLALYHKCDGTEGSSQNVTFTGSMDHRVLTMLHLPAATIADWDVTPPEAIFTEHTTSADPMDVTGSLSPMGGAKDYLAIAVAHQQTSLRSATYPYPDNNTREESSASGSACAHDFCSDEINSATISGPSWDMSQATQGVAALIVVHPAGSSGGGGGFNPALAIYSNVVIQ